MSLGKRYQRSDRVLARSILFASLVLLSAPLQAQQPPASSAPAATSDATPAPPPVVVVPDATTLGPPPAAPAVDAGKWMWTPLAALTGLGCGVCSTTCIPLTLVGGALLGLGGPVAAGAVSVFSVFGGLSSMVVQLAALGPCGSCLAGVGGTAGSLISGHRFWVALLGALPGAVIGTAGGAVTGLALFMVYSNAATFSRTGVVPDPSINRFWTLVALPGVGAAVLAGPLAMAGATVADLLWGAPRPE